MKTASLLAVAGALALVSGCATSQVSLAPINRCTWFTLDVLKYSLPATAPASAGKTAPLFSQSMVKHAGERYAIVRCLIDARGTSRDIQCVESSDTESAQAAVKLVSRGHFFRVERGGRALAANVEYGVVFHPQEYVPPAIRDYNDHDEWPLTYTQEFPATGGPNTAPFQHL